MSDGYLPPLIHNRELSSVERLAADGFFEGDMPDPKKLKTTDAKFKRATMKFQDFTGLVMDGQFGPRCLATMETKRCALPALNKGFVRKGDKWVEFNVAEKACTRKWNSKNLTCSHNSMSFSTLSADETDKAWWQSFKDWMAVGGLMWERVPHNGRANFSHDKEDMDGRSKTLAYHYLPNCGEPSTSVLKGRYDVGEAWSFNMFRGVNGHEIGHGGGLEHSNNRNDLLYPYYQGNIVSPQAGDVKRWQARYGKPSGNQPTDPAGDPDPGAPVSREEFNELRREVLFNRALIEIFHKGN